MSIVICESCTRPIGHSDEAKVGICTRCENAGYTVEEAQQNYQRRQEAKPQGDNNNEQ